MNERLEVRVAPVISPTIAGGARWLILRLSTDNPFYVLSALLMLVGLWTSFGSNPGTLMLGMAAYTLLLAVPACLLVRFGGVWEDVRTVLLVVVLMFLATSVTFDETLGRDPERGLGYSLFGLAFALALSEGLLRVMRLRLPVGFKVPYILALCLFFGYPAAMVPVLDRPRSAELQWALYGFPAAEGLVALTLLPAVRKGSAYLEDNGSPWPWPFYPWALFVFLAFGVVTRSFLLCWSMQLVERQSGVEVFIFGPYFLAPFVLSVGVLLLAAGRGSGLIAPMAAVLLSAIGHRGDALYQGFLREFTTTVGVTPLFASLVAGLVFYAIAALRKVPGASAWVTATLFAMTVIGPDALDLTQWSVPGPWSLVLLASWQSLLCWRRGEAGRCLLVIGLLAMAVLCGPGERTMRIGCSFHLALTGILTFGAVHGGTFGRDLRMFGAWLAAAAGLGVVGLGMVDPVSLPGWVIRQYPPSLVVGMACYGIFLCDRPAFLAAGAVLVAWLGVFGWSSYSALRDRVTGLDAIVIGLALLAIAQLISLAKAGMLPDWVRLAKPNPRGLRD